MLRVLKVFDRNGGLSGGAHKCRILAYIQTVTDIPITQGRARPYTGAPLAYVSEQAFTHTHTTDMNI